MTRLLQGKVAIVTGAGRGLGRAHALALASHGAAVLVNDLGGSSEGVGASEAPARVVAAEIERLGGRAIADGGDISDWDGAGQVVERAIAAFGRLDILVNNAGIARFETIDRLTRENWDRTIAVNLTGTAAMCHWAAAHWRKLGPEPGRAIVNTSSPAGTNPVAGSPPYCASKAAVAALTMSAAIELAELGVRVNAIAPMARTRMTEAVPALDEIMAPVTAGFDRVAPEHVAPLVVYLASPTCRFTGRTFGIEGDDLFLFTGFSADLHLNAGGVTWTQETLSAALAEVDPQDRGWNIAPSTRFPGPKPGDEVLDALAAVAVNQAKP